MIWGWERIEGNCFRVFKHLEHGVIYDHLKKDKLLFLRTPAVKVDNSFHCSVHSLLLKARMSFQCGGGPHVCICCEGLGMEGGYTKSSHFWFTSQDLEGMLFFSTSFLSAFLPSSILFSLLFSSSPTLLPVTARLSFQHFISSFVMFFSSFTQTVPYVWSKT